jgi:hypothetical protein
MSGLLRQRLNLGVRVLPWGPRFRVLRESGTSPSLLLLALCRAEPNLRYPSLARVALSRGAIAVVPSVDP